jgi:hypothetical protein
VTFSYWTMRVLLLVRRPLGVRRFISIRNSIYKFDILTVTGVAWTEGL